MLPCRTRLARRTHRFSPFDLSKRLSRLMRRSSLLARTSSRVHASPAGHRRPARNIIVARHSTKAEGGVVRIALALVAALLWSGLTSHAQTYPAKTVRVLVG